MLRKILCIFVFSSFLFANVEDVEFLADSVSQENGVVTATNNVVAYSQNYLITADKAIYDQNSSVVEFFGNVNMMRGASEISRSNYVRLNLKDNTSSFERLFMMNKDLEIWLRSTNSSSDDGYYRTKNLVVSSCNVNDPDWKISASSANLNKESKFLHLYNPVFYISDVPVFYLPYFGFSTDTTRRTGLLPPNLGYSKKDGFYYKQPIYLAPYNSWDLEFAPQIRTLRGSGIYGAFRFVDSPYSKAVFSFGIFKDKDSYLSSKDTTNQERLKNKNHKGVGFLYDRSLLFKGLIDKNLQESLWIKSTFLNDIEYLNLKGRDDNYDSLVRSSLNYYISGDNHYFGAYAKYYIDTEKVGSINENKDTLQEYPSLQYHKFTSPLFIPNLIYSLDLQSHRYDRKIGVEANQYEFDLPLSFRIPLFDESLTFSFYERLYASHIDYKNKISKFEDFSQDKSKNFISNYHKFSIYTDLAKSYDNFYHTINYGIDYILPGFKKGTLDEQYIYDQDGIAYENFLTKQHKKEEISANLTQYFYNKNGDKFLRHSISQGYYTKEGEYGNLKNYIALYPFQNLIIYNRAEYSYKDKDITNMYSGVSYSNEKFGASINHTLKRENELKDNYITSSVWLGLPKQYKILTGFQYDLETDYTKMWRIGLIHHRKCWNYGLTYQQDYEPVTTIKGSASKKTQGIYFSISFYPMGGLNYDYSFESGYENE